MITKSTTIYICEYCRKYLQRKNAMEYHEQYCSKKPENIPACQDCRFLETIGVEYSAFELGLGEGLGVYERDVTKQGKCFHCTKLDKKMYPLKAVKLGYINKWPETFEGQELMPNKCKYKIY